jgi:hypothetical protein
VLEVDARDVSLGRRERRVGVVDESVSVSGDSEWCDRSVMIVRVSQTPKFTQKYTSLASTRFSS